MATKTVYRDGVVSEMWDNGTRTLTTYDEDGDALTTREYTPEENADVDEAMSDATRLTDLETRVAALEARLDPPQPPPTTTEGVKTLEQWGGRWPNETNLLDTDGTVYRNISGNILTTAPSGFPGEPSAWEHLFVVALAPDEPVDPVDPTGAEPWVQPVGSHDAYSFGDERTHNGRLWRSTNPGTRTNTWAPGVYGWEDIGSAP